MSEQIEQDPYLVFEPEYWGDTVAFEPRLARVASAKECQKAAESFGMVTAEILKGEQEGQKLIPDTYFAPKKPSNSSDSYNQPGTIFIYDQERLFTKFTSKLEEATLSDPIFINASTRTLLMSARKFSPDNHTMTFGDANLAVTRGSETYHRRVAISYVGGSRRRPTPIDLRSITYDLESLRVMEVVAGRRSIVASGKIMESQIKKKTASIRRIRSVEIYTKGTRAPDRSGLGKFVTRLNPQFG